MCVVLPNGLVLQAVNVEQLNIMSEKIKEPLGIVASTKHQ